MLLLPNDTAPTGALLEDHLAQGGAPLTGPAAIIAAIARGCPDLAARLAAGLLPGDPAALVGNNESGDAQKALDVGAHHHMLQALQGCGLRQLLSEEAEDIVTLDPEGQWDIAIDPIDGSGSIGIGAPLGLLFAIFPAAPEGFLRSGRAVVAAGYVSFGHSVDLGWSLGDGVHSATFDAAAQAFRVVRQNLRLKPQGKTLAYNASNERHWHPGLQRWIAEVREGKDGPRGRDFNMRWLGAAVGDLHRILLQGGVFLYPADRRKGYEQGRLRTLYEAFPMAFLIEQAGGLATDGQNPILDRVPTAPHEHCPLVFGASEEVSLIARYLTETQ